MLRIFLNATLAATFAVASVLVFSVSTNASKHLHDGYGAGLPDCQSVCMNWFPKLDRENGILIVWNSDGTVLTSLDLELPAEARFIGENSPTEQKAITPPAPPPGGTGSVFGSFEIETDTHYIFVTITYIYIDGNLVDAIINSYQRPKNTHQQ